MFSNLENIKTNGIKDFIDKQKIRIDILNDLLTFCDDDRAKSFFCQTCALLPLDKLQEIHNESQKAVTNVKLKEKNKFVKKLITEITNSLGIKFENE